MQIGHAYRHVLCPGGKSLSGLRCQVQYHVSTAAWKEGSGADVPTAYLGSIFSGADGLVMLVDGSNCYLERANFVRVPCRTGVLLL